MKLSTLRAALNNLEGVDCDPDIEFECNGIKMNLNHVHMEGTTVVKTGRGSLEVTPQWQEKMTFKLSEKK